MDKIAKGIEFQKEEFELGSTNIRKGFWEGMSVLDKKAFSDYFSKLELRWYALILWTKRIKWDIMKEALKEYKRYIISDTGFKWIVYITVELY